MEEKEIVRSVKPYWFYLICEGIKAAEIGKSKPTARDWNKVVNLYCSKDKKSFNRIPKAFRETYRKYLGKIGARFICNKIEQYHNFILEPANRYEAKALNDIIAKTCVSQSELCEYLNEREAKKPFYLWNISKLEVHQEPWELYDFFNYEKHEVCLALGCFSGDCWGCANNAIMVRPPQSWGYVKEARINV